MKIIDASEISKVYETRAEKIFAVNKVSFSVAKGEFVAVMGPSGSGKTTLLDLLGCLNRISSGKLYVAGTDVSEMNENQLVQIRRKHFGYVFQDFLLIPTLTAVENVEFGLTLTKKKGNRNTALEALEKVGLSARINHFPAELSGGERQRTAIARALVSSPELLIADEPTGNLDSSRAEEITMLLKKLSNEGAAVIVATHDSELAESADRILRLKDGMTVS